MFNDEAMMQNGFDIEMAKVIYPVLKRYRDYDRLSAPLVDNADVPIHLWVMDHEEVSDDDEWDRRCEAGVRRWNYVLDEMLFAFGELAREYDDDDEEYVDIDEERVDNGFRLFGKYYRALSAW